MGEVAALYAGENRPVPRTSHGQGSPLMRHLRRRCPFAVGLKSLPLQACRVHCLYFGRLAVILLDEAPFGGLRRVWHLLVFNSSGRVNKGRKQWVAAIYEPLRYTPPSKTRIRICGARWFLTCRCCSVCCGVVLMMVGSSEVRRQGSRHRRVRTG